MTKLKPIKAWAVVNIDIDFTEEIQYKTLYFATIYFDEQHAISRWRVENLSSTDLHILPVLITPIQRKVKRK